MFGDAAGTRAALGLSPAGQTPITALPVTITAPGSYVLTQDFRVDIAGGGADFWAIQVGVSGVAIDLNGHTITNTNGAANRGVGIYGTNRSNVTVRNGTLAGFQYGIDLTASSFAAPWASFGHVIADVKLLQNRRGGALLQGTGCRIYRCQAALDGEANVPGQGASVGFELDGTGNSIEGCDVSGEVVTPDAASACGIVITSGPDNFVVNNRLSGVEHGILSVSPGSCKYRDNLTSGVATPYSGGTDVGNNH